MSHDTIYITDVENEILSVFTKRKVFDNPTIIATLNELLAKLENDMHVQLRRTERGAHYIPLDVDAGFVRGTMTHMPRVGFPMQLFYTEMDKGWLVTTPVTSIVRDGAKWIVKTRNSTYTLLRGWGTAS